MRSVLQPPCFAVLRCRCLALLLGLAVALLPLHAIATKPLVALAGNVVHQDDGCLHGKAKKAADAPGHCAACGVCHVLEVVALVVIVPPDAARVSAEAGHHQLRGLALQPDLHPPTA